MDRRSFLAQTLAATGLMRLGTPATAAPSFNAAPALPVVDAAAADRAHTIAGNAVPDPHPLQHTIRVFEDGPSGPGYTTIIDCTSKYSPQSTHGNTGFFELLDHATSETDVLARLQAYAGNSSLLIRRAALGDRYSYESNSQHVEPSSKIKLEAIARAAPGATRIAVVALCSVPQGALPLSVLNDLESIEREYNLTILLPESWFDAPGLDYAAIGSDFDEKHGSSLRLDCCLDDTSQALADASHVLTDWCPPRQVPGDAPRFASAGFSRGEHQAATPTWTIGSALTKLRLVGLNTDKACAMAVSLWGSALNTRTAIKEAYAAIRHRYDDFPAHVTYSYAGPRGKCAWMRATVIVLEKGAPWSARIRNGSLAGASSWFNL